jgi:tetratricopeptide (TPR) repeat protein
MTFRAFFFQLMMVVPTCWALCGCSPAGSGPLDEEKEPYFLAGKNRISTLDFKGAVQCFEKALQVNPESASAHFELGWIFDTKEVDPAAAIYHYEHYLLLRKRPPNADLTRQRIMACKQTLAEAVSLGPVTEKMQRQFEQLTDEKKQLTEENKRLKDDLEKWTSYAARLQTMTNPPAPVTAQSRAVAPRASLSAPEILVSQTVSAGSSNSSSNRTHTVKAGETPSLIARKYGLKLDALMAANPNLDARRMRVGQVLRIPGS